MEVLKSIANWAANTGIKIVIAIVLLIVSFNIINSLIVKLEKKLSEAKKMDQTLVRALANIARVGLKVIVVICLVGYLGIDTSGLAALVASLGVCVGLAVNGALSNFAGGALILVTRPFKIGDYISAQGYEGVVEDIHIISTKVITVDNKVVYIPNGALSAGTIVNYSEKQLRRVDLEFSVAGNDPVKVKEVILGVCTSTDKALTTPEPFAKIVEFGNGNGTHFTVRVWCNTADYWDVYFGLLANMNKAFEENGIVVPFNQLDVHVKND